MKTALFVASNSHSLLHFRRALIERLIELHFSVVVCCPKDEHVDSLMEECQKLGVKVIFLDVKNTKKNIFYDLVSFLKIRKIIKENSINCVFLYHIKPVVYGSIAAYMSGVKQIYSTVTGLGYPFTEKKRFSFTQFVLKRVLVLSLFLNKKIFFQNRDDLNFICKSKALKKSSVLVNGSGVDVDIFKFTPIPEKTSFLFVGRLLKHKGIYEYMEACRSLKKK